MARQRQEMPPNYLGEPAAVPGRRRGGAVSLLDAGRMLMLLGWGTLAAAAWSTGNRPSDDGVANAGRAIVGFLLWLVGVSLVTVVTPVAQRGRLPRVARRGGAVCNLVVGCFFPLWN